MVHSGVPKVLNIENLYSPQMVELRNNKNNNNLKTKLHEKAQVTILTVLT